MVMIRVVITGPAVEGRFNYRIETEGTRLAAPLTGLAAAPLLDACRKLKDMGAAEDDATVGLFDETKYRDQWRMRTTVGYGSRVVASEGQEKGPALIPGMTPDAISRVRGRAAGALKSSEGTETAPQEEKRTGEAAAAGREGLPGPTGEPPAISEEPPPPPHKSPRLLGGKDRPPLGPDKPTQPPRKRKPVGSGGRRGRR